jgi:hypothetical protein
MPIHKPHEFYKKQIDLRKHKLHAQTCHIHGRYHQKHLGRQWVEIGWPLMQSTNLNQA